jgi:sugar lactone lactonase YvrE
MGLSNVAWEPVFDGLGCLEAPRVDDVGAVWFSDVTPPGAVHRLETDGRLTTVVSRAHVGGLVAHADGGFVATGVSVAVFGASRERVALEAVNGWGFNDLTTDGFGNVFVGMHGERPTAAVPEVEASLWRIAAGGEVTCCYGGIQMTNGLAVSPDGARLYHNDTLPAIVWVSDLSPAGLPENRRIHHRLRRGRPDGMAIDEAGCVWVAAIGAGAIVRVTPEGEEDLVLEVPRALVSSVCFGGPDRRDLYVTTFGGAPYDAERPGAILRTRVAVPGAPTTPARI